MDSLGDYLKPTRLCDFDQAHEIRETAQKLTKGSEDRRQIFDRISKFVKELPYGLEDWDVKASDTLHKGWGMCSSKTNLLVAMLRCLGIPARYRIIKIKSEGTLWRWVAGQNGELARKMGEPAPEQDHVMAEVYLGGWEAYDPSRDTPFAEGLKTLGIPLERKLLFGPEGNPRLTILASFDEWSHHRQQARRFREDRDLIFSAMNAHFDKLRLLGRKQLSEAGRRNDH